MLTEIAVVGVCAVAGATIAVADAPLSELTQFGVAGLMGAMWLWERYASRTRDGQLTEAHDRILSDGVKIEVLIKVVEQNAQAITRLTDSQEQLMRQRTGK